MRWLRHIQAWKAKVHPCKEMQTTYNIHGLNHFTFSVIEMADSCRRFERELYWIRRTNPETSYNVCRYRHSDYDLQRPELLPTPPSV